jgi:hypothetical protein
VAAVVQLVARCCIRNNNALTFFVLYERTTKQCMHARTQYYCIIHAVKCHCLVLAPPFLQLLDRLDIYDIIVSIRTHTHACQLDYFDHYWPESKYDMHVDVVASCCLVCSCVARQHALPDTAPLSCVSDTRQRLIYTRQRLCRV